MAVQWNKGDRKAIDMKCFRLGIGEGGTTSENQSFEGIHEKEKNNNGIELREACRQSE